MTRVLTFLMVLIGVSSMAQAPLPIDRGIQDGAVPTVFLIGENERSYEQLLTRHSAMLLAVCENDMNVAYSKWIDLLSSFEAFADKSEFDIKGVKMWLNVFWNPDGSIQHLVYHPKPNSKNIDVDILSNLLLEFSKTYVSDIENDGPFSHYGSAAFPTFPMRYKAN